MRLWTSIIASFAIATSGYGEDTGPIQNALGGRILWGDCVMTNIPTGKWSSWPVWCVKAAAATDALFNISDTSGNILGLYADFYSGLHLLPWFSWHYSARRSRLHFIAPSDSSLPDEAEVESSYLQFGNPALHRVRLLIGRAPMPYGLDIDVLPRIFRLRMKDRQYWDFPDYSARLTYDNLLDTIIDLGVATDKIPEELRSSLKLENYTAVKQDSNGEKSVSARLSHDISALGGTRVMVYHLRSDRTDKRYGAAVVNEPRRDTTTSFEWQRRYLQNGTNNDIQQLFRLLYWGPFDRGQRFIFEYEDNRTIYWMLTLGQEYRIFDQGKIRFNLGYYRRESGPLQSHFFFSTGVEVKL